MISRVHHLGVVVRSLEGAYGFWRDTLGLPVAREAELPDQGVGAALLACGSSEIEVLEPTVAETGVARFLARGGEGAHHVCFESDDVGREVARLRGLEVEVVDRVPRKGLAGMIAFLHPRSSAGVLVELATPTDHAPLPAAPLTLIGVDLRVEGANAAARRFEEILSVSPPPRGEASRPVASLDVGCVTVRLSEGATPAPSRAIAGLSMVASRLDDVAARLARGGVRYRRGADLTLDPGSTSGVPLTIRQHHA